MLSEGTVGADTHFGADHYSLYLGACPAQVIVVFPFSVLSVQLYIL